MSTTANSLFDLPLTSITGEETSLAPFRGKVLLLVNVASQCGLTPQYEALERLYNTYKHCGFSVLGFPANNFAEQEPGTSQEIAKFCTSTFGASFPMFEKLSVNPPDQHPLYEMLTTAQPVAQGGDPGFRTHLDEFLAPRGEKTTSWPDVLWNFEKFLVDRRGRVVARFAPDVLPDDPRVIRAIESCLPPLAGSVPEHPAH